MADLSARPDPAPRVRQRDLDCFYVYPTVSREDRPNADLTVQKEETDVAVAQASRFSTACRVWAPMYRQRTISDLFNLPHGAAQSPQNRLALTSVRTAWRDYLAHHNDGRRIVLIGHSQGASMLIRLIRADIDDNPKIRARIALALLIGGNVTTADGATTGGSFRHLPLCTRPRQTGCVIAYSSYPRQPPSYSLFGRPGEGVSALSGETRTAGVQVACVNPAAIGGGRAPLHPYYPTAQLPTPGVTTPWVTEPDRFTAQCRHAGTATWLQVTPAGGSRDKRPGVGEKLGPAWGYHIVDVNLALGDLVADVAALP
jgi:hypothetical protein